GRNRGADFAHAVTDLRLDGAVAEPALLALAVALQRRRMIGHGVVQLARTPCRVKSRRALRLRGRPQAVDLVGVERVEARTARPGRRLDPSCADGEALVRPAKGHLGRDVEVPGDADDGEEQVAELALGCGAVVLADRGLELVRFLPDLRDDAAHVRPVEADLSGLLAE